MSRLLTALAVLVLGLLPMMARAEYAVSAGDTLQVEVLEDPTLNRQVLVLPDGTINFPGAGSLRVQGRSIAQVQSALTSALAAEFLSPPTIYVSVLNIAPPTSAAVRTSQVFVMGEVTRPGELQVRAGTTILQALAQAGGFSRFAAQKRIELHRVNAQSQREEVFLFDYNSNSGISGSTPLVSGDVIVVPARRLFE